MVRYVSFSVSPTILQDNIHSKHKHILHANSWKCERSCSDQYQPTQRATWRNSNMQRSTEQRIIALFSQIYFKSRLHHFLNLLKTNLSCECTYPKIDATMLLELPTRNLNWFWKPKLKGCSLLCTFLLSSGYCDLVFCHPSTMSLIVKCIDPLFSKTVKIR